MNRSEALVAAVREILLKDWDPIEVAHIAPADEYDSYIGGVLRLIEEKASADKIARHLRDVAKTQMNIAGNEQRTWAAAEKLAALAASD